MGKRKTVDRIWLCPPDPDRLVTPHDACPAAAEHTKQPEGYIEWDEWAKRMSRTHKQQRCPTCGLYAIWVPKPKGTTS